MDDQQIKQKMQAALDVTVTDMASVRTGRVTPALVENIVVPAYGGTQKMRILELASINVTDPYTLTIEPWDKSIIGDIRKGILEANVGLNPSLNENLIRISVPPLTGEDREKYVKLLSQKLENGKIMVRQIRADAMQALKKDYEAKATTEDEKFAKEKKVQEMTDEYIKKIDEMGEAKKKELLTL